MWEQFERVIKKNGAILIFCQTPYDKVIGMSNLKLLKYEWIWEKTEATGFLNANKMPLKAHENILVFYQSLPFYNPQKTSHHNSAHNSRKYATIINNSQIYGKLTKDIFNGGSTERYPRSILTFQSDKQKNYILPTQKPVKLMEYFIKTYTAENKTVLDSFMGSGTVGIACINTNRNFIGIEKDDNNYRLAKERITEKYNKIKYSLFDNIEYLQFD